MLRIWYLDLEGFTHRSVTMSLVLEVKLGYTRNSIKSWCNGMYAYQHQLVVL